MQFLRRWFDRPTTTVKIIVSLVVLFHFSAIFSHVLSGGGPMAMRQVASYYRPYLKTMWLDNGYRFYAPDPGPTEVIWYKLQYDDGSTHWTQVPRREDFNLRMPFQRHMSIALLASMMNELEPVKPKEDAASVASVLINNTPTLRTVLTPVGEVFFRSYARHLGRVFRENAKTNAKLVSMECYFVRYLIRGPYQMRMNWDMYDPRLLKIDFIATFTPDGIISNFEPGFRERMSDDFFIELMQNEILPLLEANQKRPPAERQTILQILKDYGIPHPLVQPLVRDEVTEEEREQFFQKPYDRDSLRERYATIVKRFDKQLPKVQLDPMNTHSEVKQPSTINDKPADKAPRGVQ